MNTNSPTALRGILTMVAAVAVFAFMDAGLKLLSAHYPPMQVAALRGLSSLPLVLIWALLDGGPRQLLKVRWSLHLMRGALAILMLAAFAFALRTLPLAEAYSIFFVAPLLVTVMAVPVLGERVKWQQWVAIAVGMAGVLVVLRPSGSGVLTWSGLAMLVSALAYAVSAISVRVLGRTDTTQAMMFWLMTMLSVGAVLLALPSWEPIQRQHWLLLLGIGITGTLGQYGVTEAFRRAPASVVAPFEYTALAWALGLDWFLWTIAPDRITLIGASIIVLSGVYLVRRERAPEACTPP